jgi:hydrogenase maturation factor HypF (carbamoyltransferase family)
LFTSTSSHARNIGELLRCDLATFERLAWLDPVPLPGGEAAIREPWRVAAAHLERAGMDVPWERWPAVRESLQLNAPLSSGMGRRFDAVAAVLGVREEVTYAAAAAACAEAGEPGTVVLSGGTFQNLRLLNSTRARLEAHGFRVLTHRRVPPNDGGISYGQAAVAAARLDA